jgi:nitrite reductase (NADH) small subunit
MKSEIELVRLGTRSELPACGEAKEFFGRSKAICVVNLEGEFYAMDNICPHWGGPLGQGKIENGRLRCPWHGWDFDPKTGRTTRKANVSVATHPLRVAGEDVYIVCADAREVPLDTCLSNLEKLKQLGLGASRR